VTSRTWQAIAISLTVAFFGLIMVAGVLAARASYMLAAVGVGGPQRYLVLAQNPAELRPAGGYTGTVGVVGFANGRLAENSFADVYFYDLRPGVPFVEPPEELANHLLGSASWQLADAAWSPDFPTSARDALHAYTLESGDDDIDGVIALTTFAVDRLLEVTGPIEVPEYNVTVAAGEVTLSALRLTRGVSTPTSDRKAFLDVLGHRVVERISSLTPIEWPRLADAFRGIRESRELMVWFRDPQLQSTVASAPLGGAMRHDPGDYLFVVEANVSPTSKFNLVVRRSDTLNIQLDANGNATSDLGLVWQNDSMLPGEPYESIRAYSTSNAGLYGAYVRVLTPASTSLVATDGAAVNDFEGVEHLDVEAGRNVFGNYLLMGPGSSSLSYEWSTPGAATSTNGTWTYELTLQKQSGAAAVPTTVTITLPQGAVVEAVAGARSVDGTVTLSTDLMTDERLKVSYRL
jgi:hypothetical protein